MTLFLCFWAGGIQHKVKLGKYIRDSDSVQKEGENLQAVWSPDTKLIAILVSIPLMSRVIMYSIPTSHAFFCMYAWMYVCMRTSAIMCLFRHTCLQCERSMLNDRSFRIVTTCAVTGIC